jgi:hypothetical protein
MAIRLSLLLDCFAPHRTHRLKPTQCWIELIMVQRHQPAQCPIIGFLYLISMHWARKKCGKYKHIRKHIRPSPIYSTKKTGKTAHAFLAR